VGVGFTLTDAGAEAFREAALRHGAVDNPRDHHLVMLLDNETVYSAPLNGDLAAHSSGRARSGRSRPPPGAAMRGLRMR